jgi:hypothetical protein
MYAPLVSSVSRISSICSLPYLQYLCQGRPLKLVPDVLSAVISTLTPEERAAYARKIAQTLPDETHLGPSSPSGRLLRLKSSRMRHFDSLKIFGPREASLASASAGDAVGLFAPAQVRGSCWGEIPT